MTFDVYLRSELETYSDRLLELHHRDVMKALKENRNMVLEAHSNIVRKLGYNSLDEAEEALIKEKEIIKSTA